MKFIVQVDSKIIIEAATAKEAYDKALAAGYPPEKIVVSTRRETGEYRVGKLVHTV
jgi:hypothetical protein